MSNINEKSESPNQAPDLKEMISRCEKDGNYVWRGEPCIICYLEQKKGKK